MQLHKQLVEKPWGRTDIPATFGKFGDKKIGEIWYQNDGPDPMPILVKWLFTSEKLSVQVHPDNNQAKARGQISGKEECWYIVDAKPGAVLGIGTIRPLSGDDLRASSLSGEIEELLDWKPVKAGDYFYIAAGTVHAIGAGVTLVEVQQYADITYRLYDYGRLDNGVPRELHLDDGVSVSNAKPYADDRSGNTFVSKQLVGGPHFRLWMVNDQATLASLPNGSDRWVVPVSGRALAGHETASTGDCLLVPAGERITIDSDCRMLLAMV